MSLAECPNHKPPPSPTKNKPMKMLTSSLVLMCCMLWACSDPYKVADLELGRYEYSVTNETFTFQFVAPDGRRVLKDVNKGIGRMQTEICNYIEPYLYKCNKQNLPTPFIDFGQKEASILFYKDGKMIASTLPYHELDRTIEIGGTTPQIVIAKGGSPDKFVIRYSVSYSSKPGSVPKFRMLTTDPLTRDMTDAFQEQQAGIGDTVMQYLAYQFFVKK
jgi:hypothetical protein